MHGKKSKIHENYNKNALKKNIFGWKSGNNSAENCENYKK